MPRLRTSDRERCERLNERAREHLAVQLRQLRETAGLSQAALARAANVSASTISRIELGATDPLLSTVRGGMTHAGNNQSG